MRILLHKTSLAHLEKRPRNLNSSTLWQLRQVFKSISIKSPLPATDGARKISWYLSFRKKSVFSYSIFCPLYWRYQITKGCHATVTELVCCFATVSHSLCAWKRKMTFSGKILKEDFSFWIANQQQKCAVSFVAISETVNSIFSACVHQQFPVHRYETNIFYWY